MKIRTDFVTNSSSSSFCIMTLDSPLLDDYLKDYPVVIDEMIINEINDSWWYTNEKLQKRLGEYLKNNPISIDEVAVDNWNKFFNVVCSQRDKLNEIIKNNPIMLPKIVIDSCGKLVEIMSMESYFDDGGYEIWDYYIPNVNNKNIHESNYELNIKEFYYDFANALVKGWGFPTDIYESYENENNEWELRPVQADIDTDELAKYLSSNMNEFANTSNGSFVNIIWGQGGLGIEGYIFDADEAKNINFSIDECRQLRWEDWQIKNLCHKLINRPELLKKLLDIINEYVYYGRKGSLIYNKDLALELIEHDIITNYKNLSNSLRSDINVWQLAIEKNLSEISIPKKYKDYIKYYYDKDVSKKKDKEYILSVFKEDPGLFIDNLKKNYIKSLSISDPEELKKTLLKLAKSDVQLLEGMPNELNSDRKFMLLAMNRNIAALEFASSELKSNKVFVLEAVKQNGGALKYASSELQADKEVVLEAVKWYGDAFKYASSELQADKEVVLEAVKKHGWTFKYASSELQADKEVVLEAVKWYGDAFEYASSELQADKEVVLEAVKHSGWALKYASSELQADKEVVLEAVKHSGWALEFASSRL